MAIYKSLSLHHDQNSIRLLSIQGSRQRDAPIYGSLSIARLDDRPQYQALSYCWGKSEIAEATFINDESIGVTANLASALRSLRLQHKSRQIWVDALCINQGDVAEKNFQVPLMRKIYATCSRTVVWLGDSDKASHTAFRAMQKSAKTYPNAMTSLLRRPWFRRVWVIQEVAFAPAVTLQCGEDSVEWQKLVQLVSRLRRLASTIDPDAEQGSKHFHPAFYARIMEHARLAMSNSKRLPILEALRSFRSFDATNPRDKLYGILGLLDTPELVEVDYDKPVSEVFQQVAVAILQTSRKLDFIVDCLPRQNPESPGLNSWVPDWADVEQAVEQDLANLAANEIFQASRDTSVEEIVLSDDGGLRVSAQFITTIAELGQDWPTIDGLRERYWPAGRMFPRRRAFDIIPEILDLFQNWKDVASRINGKEKSMIDRYITNETLLEALYNTLQNRGPPIADFDESVQFDKWTDFIEVGISVLRWWQRHISQNLPWVLTWIVSGPFFCFFSVSVVVLLIFGRVVIDPPPPPPTSTRSSWLPGRTDNGLLCLFPAPSIVAPQAASSRPGDAVVILKGGARPCILRRQGKKWRFIGDAYIHGIMHGAAFDEKQCVPIELL